jgi:hypothetical protein
MAQNEVGYVFEPFEISEKAWKELEENKSTKIILPKGASCIGFVGDRAISIFYPYKRKKETELITFFTALSGQFTRSKVKVIFPAGYEPEYIGTYGMNFTDLFMLKKKQIA